MWRGALGGCGASLAANLLEVKAFCFLFSFFSKLARGLQYYSSNKALAKPALGRTETRYLYLDKVHETFLAALESSEERDGLFESLGARNTTGNSFGKRK